MMDTVYGTKKYFQSLSGGSDIYRSSTCRAVGNDYSSYQNTLGRRSGIGPYSHMNKHPSYSTDLSLNSQYAYSTWGMWRDPRNLSPSTYSAKSRASIKSFSIILITAAFIVLLAVISIAGLAFYFSTFKSNLDDPVMAFEGRFRIAKGDLFTTGLKYNHTSSFKQKVDFYKRFIERSLSDNGLQTARVDIMGFGDGPLINVHFRTFLDMRKLPQNIHSMEEHIRESLFLETTSLKSLYRSLRIDADSVDIKRIIDEKVIKSASFSLDSAPSTSQTHFEKRLTKKTGIVEKAPPKSVTTQRSKLKPTDDEPDVDVENAPVIQGSFEGSFEITKTDADITRKKTSPTKSVTVPTKATTPPSFSMKPKTKKTTIEKITKVPDVANFRTTTPVIPSTTRSTTMSTTQTTASSTISTTTEHLTSMESTTRTTTSTTQALTSKPTNSVPPKVELSSTTPSSTTTTTTTTDTGNVHSKFSNVQDPPKLDANLFTSAPILDTEPWRPIRPPNSSDPPKSVVANSRPITNLHPSAEIDAFESGLLPRNKIKLQDPATDDPNKTIFYHSFTNPVFMPGTSEIEKLGNSDVKPHPLPVPLIDDVIIPEFKPLGQIPGVGNFPESIITSDDNKFEHIGGGVIVKKHNDSFKTQNEYDSALDLINSTTTAPSSPSSTASTQPENTSHVVPMETHYMEDTGPTAIDKILEEEKEQGTMSTQLSEKIGELLYDLLDFPKDDSRNNSNGDFKVESRIEPETEQKPTFWNIKEHVLSKNKTGIQTSTTTQKSETTAKTNSATSTTITKKVKPNTRPKPTLSSSDSSKTTPVTLDDSMLFPSHSKWEFVNGSSNSLSTASTSMRKVFNETLQAWVVENIEKPEGISFKELKAKKNNTENIQNISIIFDTLASKLGISPTMPTKVPPFGSFSQNKLKQAQKNDTIRNRTKTTTSVRPVTVTKRTSAPVNQSPVTVKPTITTTSTTTTRTTTTTTTIPPLKSTTLIPPDNQGEIPNISPEVIVGEAEVEVVDPTKYEEMLSSQSASTSTVNTPTLVTLLPVRSNSGIRTFRPPSKASEGRRFSYHPRYREAVVKTGIHVTA